ncbi:uncharacterized protein [Coffea arabica]|uniref:Uncharacterized protein n=1 Tax=Coffea arabica TaxID=13443 RepID=A0ABM4V2V2_COFAR|nr:uncharacterized protein LOC113699519 [Coffea arabica]
MANEKENPRGGSYGRGDHQEMVAGLLFSQKPGFDLMQNCDLPPPVKIFAGHDKTIVSPMNNVYSMIAGQKDEDVGVEMAYDKTSETEKLELLKALRLSQTRAREAERKAAVLSRERDDLSNLLLQQSMHLFAYKQWVRMMELQLPKLNKHQEKRELSSAATNWEGNMPKEEGENNGEKGMTWLVTVAICVGIAGFGFYNFFSSYY